MIFEARRDVPSRFRPLRGGLRGEQVDAGLVAVAGRAHYGGLDPRLPLGSQVRALVGSSMPGRRGKMELSHIRPGFRRVWPFWRSEPYFSPCGRTTVKGAAEFEF